MISSETEGKKNRKTRPAGVEESPLHPSRGWRSSTVSRVFLRPPASPCSWRKAPRVSEACPPVGASETCLKGDPSTGADSGGGEKRWSQHLN